MVQPYPSGGKPLTDAERPPAPPPVLNAVKLLYAGAAVSTVSLIISLVNDKVVIEKAPPNLTTTQISQLTTFVIGLAIVSRLVGIALWLWMARANGQGKNWARILSTVLFGLATLDLIGVFRQPKTILGPVFPVLAWLVGGGAVWLLWRPESTAFFKRPDIV